MPNLKIDTALNAKAQPVEDANGNASPLTLATDKVGIGTANPLRLLQVGSSIDAAFTIEPADASPNAGYIRFGDRTGWKLHFGRSREGSALNNNPLNTGTTGVLMTVQDNGNVGFGTTDPLRPITIGSSPDAAFTIEPTDGTPNAGYIRFGDGTGWRLHFGRSREGSGAPLNTGKDGVLLTIEDTGTIFVEGDIVFSGADCAEDFDVEGSEFLERGTVMVIGDENRLCQSTSPYDTRVAGVLSGAGDCRAGIILGKDRSRQNRLPLALNGKAFCKADAHYAPIKTGDLLTTCPTPGHAMKASDPLRAFGAVIGKALQPLAQGRGLIPVLIALH